MNIPFNKPYMSGKELEYIKAAHENKHFSGNGPFTKKAQMWLEKNVTCKKAFLTNSGTAALEMAAILADIRPGDEVIMPSYTFVSTANAFVLRGGVPVFVDIRQDTLNLDEELIEEAITPKTKVIVSVHYAGVSCDMDAIMDIARKHNILVIEDAAQGIGAGYKKQPLGSIGSMASMSFHETKNIISGEGGALLINDAGFIKRAEIIWEKGTDRCSFARGEVDKYTWVDIGSSYLPADLISAFLYAQMEEARNITDNRLRIWERYNSSFSRLEKMGKLRCPIIPEYCQYNAHMYYLVLPDSKTRGRLIDYLNKNGINAIFHYVPLHASPAGIKYGRKSGGLPVTESISDRMVRLPLWIGMKEEEIDYVASHIEAFLR